MGDQTRIKLLVLLSSEEPLNGQELAERLGVKAPTISHHISKLKEISAVYERREKNTVYYYLNQKSLKQYSDGLFIVLDRSESWGKTMEEQKEREQILQNFLAADGKLKSIPAQRKKKLIVFEHIVRDLEIGKKYSEKEINEHIQQFHEDYATIRREFIINHYMYREAGIYELNPKEMWAK
jgi:biotin operon repressor